MRVETERMYLYPLSDEACIFRYQHGKYLIAILRDVWAYHSVYYSCYSLLSLGIKHSQPRFSEYRLLHIQE